MDVHTRETTGGAWGGNGGVVVNCLSEDQVMALLRGEMERTAFEPVEGHLDVCRLCRLLVSTLAARTFDDHTRSRQVPSAFVPGDVVAERYRVSSLLGVGGMGEVYEALDTFLGETIALKTVAVDDLLRDWAPLRLKTEVQFARRVTHRNVCRVFDVGFHTEAAGAGRGATVRVSLPFFTMELLRGQTLRRHIQHQGPLPVERALAILEQMASGLDAAHDAGVVHRDLKTENVMLVPSGGDTRVVITDFGLARPAPNCVSGQASACAGTASRQGGNPRTVAGTFGYMAPEQLAGEATGPATDLYAMGIVAFELVTGELPFTFSKVVEVDGKSLRGLAPALPSRTAIPPRWDAAIRRCLRAVPEERFQRAGELIAALRPQALPRPATSRRARSAKRGALIGVSGLAVITPVLLAAAWWPGTATRGRQDRSATPTVAAAARASAPPGTANLRATASPAQHAPAITLAGAAVVPAVDQAVVNPESPQTPGRSVPPLPSEVISPPSGTGMDDLVYPFSRR